MDDSHDGGGSDHLSQDHGRSSNKHPLLRPFWCKHKQEELADSTFLGDLNRPMRSSHDRPMAAPMANGGEGKSTDGSSKPSAKPTEFLVKKVRYCYSKPMSAADKAQHRRRRLIALERIDQAAAGEEEDKEQSAHASDTKPNVRAPPTPPVTAEPTEERKAAIKAHPPQQPVLGTGKVNAGDQGPGPSSSPPRPSEENPVRSSSHHHHSWAPEPVGIRDDEEEAALRLGMRAARTMKKETRKSEVYKYFGVEDLLLSGPQRLVAMQSRDADRPPFDFRLPEERAMADVREVLSLKRKRSSKDDN